MCSIIAILVLIFSGFLGYSLVEQSSTVAVAPTPEISVATAEAVALPTEAIACATQPASSDMAEMQQLISPRIFESALWTRENGAGDQRTTMTWRSDRLGAVAYLEFLHFDCGVTQEQIDQYFSPENFDVILANYTSHQLIAQCEHNGVKLFEFDVTANSQSYHLLYWVKQVTPTRVADLTLTFPSQNQAKLAGYAGRLFPDLPTCTAAAG